MISNDEIFNELKETRRENNEAHRAIYQRMNTSDERLTRCEEQQKATEKNQSTLFRAIGAVALVLLGAIITWITGLFGGNK